MGEAEVAAALARASEEEIAAALGGARWWAALLARLPSRRLGRILARFDSEVAREGIGAAARGVLRTLGASVHVEGALPGAGAVLVVTNHPGAYDAFALMAALGRDDLAFLAADRRFLRALPSLAEHLLFASDTSAFGRLAGLRAALAHLARGGVVVQFGAGAIEPDARFDDGALLEWSLGTGVLASRAALVVPVFVSGVHSPRAKRLRLVRWAERRGVTTLAPLLQATLPGFRDVSVSVRIGHPVALEGRAPAECTTMARAAVSALAEGAARRSGGQGESNIARLRK